MRKAKLLIILALTLLVLVPLTGCFGYTETEIFNAIDRWLEDYENNQSESSDVAEAVDAVNVEGLSLQLTFPAGYSPNVFTNGWVFGARCTYEGNDYSDQLKWSGTASFNPDTGSRSRPSFGSVGANTITLTVTIGEQDYQQSFNVNTVLESGYASIGTLARCDSYSLGCPSCPHTVTGPVTTGSSTVFINGKPAARVGDLGIAVGGCGPADFEITSGDGTVLIDGRPAAIIGSTTQHAGGVGKIIGP